MPDCMMPFPEDWHDFLKDYSFDDSEEVYTNGSRLIPVFRVEQLIKHILKAQEQKCRECGEATSKAIQELQTKLKAQEPVKPTRYQEGRWFKTWRCGACGGTLVFRNGTDKPKYCTDCGKAVKWDG